MGRVERDFRFLKASYLAGSGRRLLAGTAAILSTALPLAANAQQAEPAEAPVITADSTGEIIVTASKRNESLSDVGGSISALGGDRLSELGINSFQDFTRLVPGISTQSVTPGRTQIQIRGTNVGTTQPSSSVAVYLDEVPLTVAATSALSGDLNTDPDPFDLERIEVLRGPQGTLYGANALGGVIKYVPKAPDFTKVAGAVSGTLGGIQDGGTDYAVKGMVNVPLAAWAALRVVGYYRKDAGYIDNVALGDEDVNWARNRGGRAILELRPLDALTIKLTGVVQALDTGGDSSVDAVRNTFTPAFGDLTQFRRYPEGVRDRFYLYNGVASYDFGFATLVSSSSWTRQRFFRSTSEMIFPANTLNLYTFEGLNQKFVQEVRLQSKDAGDQGLEWQVGGFYTNERYNRRAGFPTVDIRTQQVTSTFFSGTVASYKEKAAFANATYFFSPRFDLGVGLRYSENSQSGFGLDNSGQLNGRNGRSSDDKVTWAGIARFHVTDETMLYANVSSGYRAGGPNFFAVGQAIPPAFAPEQLINYEAGLKISSSDRRFSLNLAGFYIDWSSIQLPLIVNRLTFRGNNGTAEIKGFEASGAATLVQGLTLGGTLSYTDARITSDERTGVGAVPGDRMAGTPRWSGSATIDYEAPVADTVKGFAGAAFTFSSDRPNSYRLSVNTPYVLVPGFETVSARVGVDGGPWRLTLAVDNMFNARGITDDYTFERYAGETFGLGGVGAYYDQLGVIRPRTFKLTADFSF